MSTTIILSWIFIGLSIFAMLALAAGSIYLFIIQPAIEDRLAAKRSKEVVKLIAERLVEQKAKEKEESE